MKTRNILFLAILGLGILGGTGFAKAQNLLGNNPVCLEGEGVLIEFNLAEPDDVPGDPGHSKTPVLMPTLWQDGYLLDFHGTHDDYVLRIVDATNTVVYSTVVPSYLTQLWLPTYLIGTYRIELLTDELLFYGAITL